MYNFVLFFIFVCMLKCASIDEMDLKVTLENLLIKSMQIEEHLKENIKEDEYMEQEINDLLGIWTKNLKLCSLIDTNSDEQPNNLLTSLKDDIYILIGKITNILMSVDLANVLDRHKLMLRFQNRNGCNDNKISELFEKIKTICNRIELFIFMVNEQQQTYQLKEDDHMLILREFYNFQLFNLQRIQ
ncbi:hypothetical protein EHP00_2702 [Ecytonucleospora hepatopenaei]|uniref:Uncharacterized protein n=1 Tax=Ecytonucleospora hepatopenaei TaxID=646526 RepID=A0A1W0E7V0_9MICR|nr:hypothetical protein EHP00_772 [Ecytonucleospora hepatopenaei]OQS55311.1 hypothetical protein EHP00_2702 [Ecytonucleospora hepatopenaei]